MDVELTQEQRMFQKAIREFVEKEVAPLVDEAEANESYPKELFAKFGALGYLCPAYPIEYGGGGLGKTGDCIMVEELAKINSGICAGIMINSGLATSSILAHGNEEQKQKYLIPAIQGKKVASFGLTEPNAGSDAAAIETTAKRDGDHYVINGNKMYITNGPICDFITLAVSTDKSKGSRGISVLIVDNNNTPGISMTKLRKVGHHSAATAEFAFEDCRVPVESLLGEEDKGWGYVLESVNAGRLSHSARSLGTAEVAFQAALDYAKERVQFGQPIGKFQAIAFNLAYLAMEIEAARCLLYRAVALYDQGVDVRKEASMTKLFSSEVAIHTAEQAMRIHAGAGYLAESKVQRYFRDAILYHSTEGTSEVQKLVISRQLGL